MFGLFGQLKNQRFASHVLHHVTRCAACKTSSYGVAPYPMSHTIAGKQQLIARVRRIVGQLNGVAAALEQEAGCDKVLHLVAGARGAISGLTEEIVADYVREHVAAPKLSNETRQAAADELIAMMRRYSK